MIINFPEHTKPLTAKEYLLIPGMIAGLKNHVGRENSITSMDMIKAYRRRGHVVTGPRIRKIINHICANNLVRNVCAGAEGYWISEDPKEIRDYAESLKQRARAILSKINCLDI